MEEVKKLVQTLWEDVVSQPSPVTVAALHKEHATIRRLLAQIDALNPPVTLFADRQRRLDALPDFLAWSEKMAVQANRLTVAECPTLSDDAMTLKAVGDIDEGQWLVKVPRRAMLTWDDARKARSLQLVSALNNLQSIT